MGVCLHTGAAGTARRSHGNMPLHFCRGKICSIVFDGLLQAHLFTGEKAGTGFSDQFWSGSARPVIPFRKVDFTSSVERSVGRSVFDSWESKKWAQEAHSIAEPSAQQEARCEGNEDSARIEWDDAEWMELMTVSRVCPQKS